MKDSSRDEAIHLPLVPASGRERSPSNLPNGPLSKQGPRERPTMPTGAGNHPRKSSLASGMARTTAATMGLQDGTMGRKSRDVPTNLLKKTQKKKTTKNLKIASLNIRHSFGPKT